MPHRRPPLHPLWRGLVWRELTADIASDPPQVEWAYVTPQHPEGLRRSDLAGAEPGTQVSTAECWFLSNFEPFVDDGRWPSPGMLGALPIGATEGAPEHHPAHAWLAEEFAGIIPEYVAADLADVLDAQAATWTPTPRARQIMLDVADEDVVNPRATAEDALAQVLEAVATLAKSRTDVGGNSTATPLSAADQGKVERAVQQAQDGLVAGSEGKGAVGAAQSALQAVLANVGKGVLQGLGKEAGRELYSPAKAAALHLLHSLAEAVAALGRWLLSP